jgi:anaerobic magnesium-protoporphyrin IX monomethyl ester cyclase
MPHTDILLATANFMALDPKQQRKGRPYPPLATLYAASRLRAAGFSVALFDAMLEDDERAFEACLRATAPRMVALYEDNFNFLSKMCLGRVRQAALSMAQASRAAGACVVAAGSDVSDDPSRYLAHGADYALVGEPDHALAELAAAILNGGSSPRDIAGVVTLGPDAELRRASPRAPERELDRLPPPAWDLVDVESYRHAWRSRHGHFSLNLVTTRGCPFHCNWCAKPIWGQRYAIHSPQRVAADLAHLKNMYHPDQVWFADDIFGLRPEWVVEFAHEVRRLDAAMPFTIQTRADLMTEDAVEALADAGCVEVWIGAESGSQEILNAMQKGTTIAEIAAARERVGRLGIRACFFVQFGYPGEQWAEIGETAEMLRRLMPDDIGVSVSYPLPGTPFYERVRAEIGLKTHWHDSDDLAMMFQGAYDSEFYRRLHALLHRELDIRRAMVGADQAAALEPVRMEWAELARYEISNPQSSLRTLTVPSMLPRPALDLNAN